MELISTHICKTMDIGNAGNMFGGSMLVSKIANIVYGGYGNEKSDIIVISNSRSKNKKTTMQYVLEFLGFK